MIHRQQPLMSMNQRLMTMNQMNLQQLQPQVMSSYQNMYSRYPAVVSQSDHLVNFQHKMFQTNLDYEKWVQLQQIRKPNPNFEAMKAPAPGFYKSLAPRSNWKGKRVNKLNGKTKTEVHHRSLASSGKKLNINNYNPILLNELQRQSSMQKFRKFSPKKFNKNYGRPAPFAPRNTTSFIIRTKKSGGIEPLVSPGPSTPAVLPTPVLSPSPDVLMDTAKEEWGVDGYGSMKGLIRLRSPGHEISAHENEGDEESGSGESDIEEHVEVERRLDRDLSRFEMIYNPNGSHSHRMDHQHVLENRVDDQDTHISHLEEENLILKERLFVMETEMRNLRRRMQLMLTNNGEEIEEEVVENEFASGSDESHGDECESVVSDNTKLREEDIQLDSRAEAEDIDTAATSENIVELDMEVKVDTCDKELNAINENLYLEQRSN